jgi:hypothetical protein
MRIDVLEVRSDPTGRPTPQSWGPAAVQDGPFRTEGPRLGLKCVRTPPLSRGSPPSASSYDEPRFGARLNPPASVHARVVEQLEPRWPEAARLLADAVDDLLAFTAFPKEH